MRSGHLSEQQALEMALDEEGHADAREHLEVCDFCRSRVETTRAGWHLAIEAQVPEPPEFYWQAMRRRIARQITVNESRSRYGRWLTLAVSTAAMLLAITVVAPILVDPSRNPRDVVSLAAWSPLPPLEEDSAFPVVEAFLQTESPQSNGCRLGACALELSDEERGKLAELLREEMRRTL